MSAVTIGLALLLMQAPSLRRGGPDQRRRPPRDGSVERMAQSLLVAMSAGLSLRAALVATGPQLEEADRKELDRVVRSSLKVGLGPALARSRGTLSPLLTRLAQSQITGSPVAAMLTGFLEERRAIRRADRLEQARRLPVKLTVPLALLILPGFVLATIGPAVLAVVEQTLGSVFP